MTDRRTLSFHGSSNAPNVSLLVLADMTKMTRRESIKNGFGSGPLADHLYAGPSRV